MHGRDPSLVVAFVCKVSTLLDALHEHVSGDLRVSGNLKVAAPTITCVQRKQLSWFPVNHLCLYVLPDSLPARVSLQRPVSYLAVSLPLELQK